MTRPVPRGFSVLGSTAVGASVGVHQGHPEVAVAAVWALPVGVRVSGR